MSIKRQTSRHIIIKVPKVKYGETRQSSKRKINYVQENSHQTINWYFNRNFVGQKGVAQNIKVKDLQPGLLHPERLPFTIGKEM